LMPCEILAERMSEQEGGRREQRRRLEMTVTREKSATAEEVLAQVRRCVGEEPRPHVVALRRLRDESARHHTWTVRPGRHSDLGRELLRQPCIVVVQQRGPLRTRPLGAVVARGIAAAAAPTE